MKSRYVFVLLFVLSLGSLFVLPWWGTWFVGFIIVLLLPLSRLASFTSGFLAGFLSWLLAILYADILNDHILSKKLAILFQLPSFVLLILVNALIGGLLAGSGAWLASTIRNFSKKSAPDEELQDDFLTDKNEYES